MKRAAILGFIIGLLPLPVCVAALGGGHGIVLPVFLFYGPAWGVFQAVMWPWDTHMFDPIVAFLLFPSFHAAYSTTLVYARSKGFAIRALIAIGVFHYLGGALAAWIYDDYDCSTVHILRVASSLWEWCAVGVLLFVGLNVAAIAYAIYGMPRSRQFGLRTLFVLTFVVAMACSFYAVMQRWAENYTRQPTGKEESCAVAEDVPTVQDEESPQSATGRTRTGIE